MRNLVSQSETSTVQTVERAIDILTYALASPRSPSLSDISQDLTLNKSTVHRLLSCLRSRGVLEKDAANRYRAGALVFQWCSSVLHHGGLAAIVLPFLQQLRDETGETASFHLLVAGHQVCVEQVVSRHDLRYVIETGKAHSLRIGAAGKVILAHLIDGERQSILSSGDDREAANVDTNALETELSTIRTRGIAFSIGERVTGMNGASSPVFTDSGRVMGAVTISGPASRLNLKVLQTFGPGLKEAAERISLQLGHRPEKPVMRKRNHAMG
ncbi:MAG: IclR family transcriptional regulator [Dehalococcoidia bacterium]|nr:IclR family transcriptional regulator [Dehalococcoidia bacterium]